MLVLKQNSIEQSKPIQYKLVFMRSLAFWEWAWPYTEAIFITKQLVLLFSNIPWLPQGSIIRQVQSSPVLQLTHPMRKGDIVQ